MNNAQFEGAVRSILIALAGFISGAGYIDNATAISLAGAMATICGVVWSLYSNRLNSLVSHAAESPQIIEITAHKDVVDASTNPKVVRETTVKPVVVPKNPKQAV